MMRILDIGSGPQSQLKEQFPNAEIVRLDAMPEHKPDVVLDINSEDFLTWEPEPFDLIWMSHVLEHLPLAAAHRVLPKLRDLLAEKGELHIKVPSLEWACEQIISERNSPVTLNHLYGAQTDPWQFHQSGYTMAGLRALLATKGLYAVHTQREWYQISLGDRIYDAEQHYLVALKGDMS